MNHKSKTLLSNTLIFMIGSVGTKFIQFFLVPLYTYTMTTQQFGVAEVVLTAVNLLIPVFSISIADGLLRFGLDNNYRKSDVMNVSLVIVGIGTLLSLISQPLLGQFAILGQWYGYFVWILNLRIYRDVLAINLKIHDRNKQFALDALLYTLVLCGANIITLVVFKMGVEGYFLSHILANVCSMVFLCIVGNVKQLLQHSRFNRDLFNVLLLYSLPLIINGISWWITNAADRFMIEWLVSTEAVGLYAAAAKIPTLVTTFTGVFSQAWIISAVREYEEDGETHYYATVFEQYNAVLFIGSCALIAILQPLMSVYVGPDFREAWVYTPLLVASATLSSGAAFMSGVYASTKKNINVTLTTLAGGVANIALNYVLITSVGIMGAVISTCLAWGIVLFIRLWDVRRFFTFPIRWHKLCAYIVLIALQCIAVISLPYVWGLVVSLCILSLLVWSERVFLFNAWQLLSNKVKERLN